MVCLADLTLSFIMLAKLEEHAFGPGHRRLPCRSSCLVEGHLAPCGRRAGQAGSRQALHMCGRSGCAAAEPACAAASVVSYDVSYKPRWHCEQGGDGACW